MLALGGYHALAQTASQADIVMHSRIFYYARISGTTIPYAGYRDWLRASYQSGQPARLWEWDLLEALCNHRDRLAPSAGGAASPGTRRDEAAAEKARWVRALLATDAPSQQPRPGTGIGGDGGGEESTPSWMAAAPKTELYVDRTLAANDEGGGDESSPAYPERFAAIIKAVQTGEPVEGIVEIPDIVARNPVSHFSFSFSRAHCDMDVRRFLTWLDHDTVWLDGQATEALGAGQDGCRHRASCPRGALPCSPG